MFKGFKKEFQNELGRINQETGKFIFSFGDLELEEKSEVNKKIKCRILSNKLSKELQKICSQEGRNVPQISFVKFEFFNNYWCKSSIFSNLPGDPIYKY
jgi:hypothetical protein